jgi:hypothetical protein
MKQVQSPKTVSSRLVEVAAATAVLVLAGSIAPASAVAVDHVILVSWDGNRSSVLDQMMRWQPATDAPHPCPAKRHEAVIPKAVGDYLTCMPTLSSFQMINSHDIEGKPLTRPQHAQMLTGYGPLQTGVVANAGKKSVPPGLAVYERIKAARPEVFTVHIGGRKYTGKGITKWSQKDGALDLFMSRGGRDKYTGNGTTAKVVEALDAIGDSPFFLFVHYKAVDVIGHRASDKSVPYRENMIWNDIQLKAIMNLLADRGLLDSTEIIVTTDHGFEGIFHTNRDDPNVTDTWLASMNPILAPDDATIQDVVPTILDLFGIDYSNADPPYPGHSLLATANTKTSGLKAILSSWLQPFFARRDEVTSSNNTRLQALGYVR